MTSAETAYLFRHALLRDAAYELHLPADRAKLHEFAFFLIEAAFGGPAPEPAPLDAPGQVAFVPHVSDVVAQELCHHAHLAGAASAASNVMPLYLRRAAEHAERSFRLTSAMQIWQDLARHSETSIRAAALRRCGTVALQAGLLPASEDSLSQALELSRHAGNRRLEGLILGALAHVCRETASYEKAETHLEAALAIYREVGDRDREGGACVDLATIYQQSGRIAQAEEAYRRGLQVVREAGNRRYEGIALANLGNACLQSGKLAEAEQHYREALDIARQANDRRAEGVTLGNLGIVYSETSRKREAGDAYAQALAISRETGNRRSEGIVLGHLGSFHHDAGDLRQSQDCYERSLAIHRELGNRRFEATVLCSFAITLLRSGRLDLARKAWREGRALFERIGDSLELRRKTENMMKVCAGAGVLPLDGDGP